MRIHEILNEDVSLESSIKTITDILTTELPELYRSLYKMAENYYRKHGELDKGFGLVSGSQKAMWMKSIFFNNLKPSLYSLYKNTGSPELKNYLDDAMNAPFRSIGESLLPILEKIAKNKGFNSLLGGVKATENAMRAYTDKLDRLDVDDNDDGMVRSNQPKRPNIIGQQNNSVEAIINDVLGRIDRKNAGEIRQIISRSENKLRVLQTELAKRGLNP